MQFGLRTVSFKHGDTITELIKRHIANANLEVVVDYCIYDTSGTTDFLSEAAESITFIFQSSGIVGLLNDIEPGYSIVEYDSNAPRCFKLHEGTKRARSKP